MVFLWFSEKTAIISLGSINYEYLVFNMMTCCEYCEVWIRFLNNIWINSMLQEVNVEYYTALSWVGEW
jgi:hypothetical protein